MQLSLTILIFITLAVVVGVLIAGLWNMFRGGNSKLSQKLMRTRIVTQFIVVLLLMIAVLVFAPK